MNSYKKNFENALEMIEWQNTMLRQQQEQINNLKQWERRHLDVIHSLERQLEVIREACTRSRP
jgi:Mg2+ and Co2+ transporter CorA